MTVQELIDLLMRIPRAKREKSIVCYSYMGETSDGDGILPLVLRKHDLVPVMANTKFDCMNLSLRAGSWRDMDSVQDETEFDKILLEHSVQFGTYLMNTDNKWVSREEAKKDKQYGKNTVKIAKKFLEEYEK